jgi:hypothetical protein
MGAMNFRMLTHNGPPPAILEAVRVAAAAAGGAATGKAATTAAVNAAPGAVRWRVSLI